MHNGKPEKYLALASDIRKLIVDEKLGNGDQLPPERVLAQRFQCNHLTVRRALRRLEQDNLIHKRPSIGNFVGPKPFDAMLGGFVGFIFPDDELFYYKLFARLERLFYEMGLHPIVHITNNMPIKEDEILEFMMEKSISALVAVPNLRCENTYRKLRIPVLFVDLFPENSDIPYIVSDDYSGAMAAVEYLCSIGHRRIAYIGGVSDYSATRRSQGYCDVLNRHKIALESTYIKRKNCSREWGIQAAGELLALPIPPTAVFCGNDTVAAGVVRYCVEKNIRIPEDLSLIGFGDTEIARDLSLTSVDQHLEKLTLTIVESLRLLLNGGRLPRKTMLDADLVIRRSSAPPCC